MYNNTNYVAQGELPLYRSWSKKSDWANALLQKFNSKRSRFNYIETC